MWDPDAGRDADVRDIVAALTSDSDIEGVTFFGGEPFDQAVGLAEVARDVRARGLSVMTFSGYFLEDLVTGARPGWLELLGYTDLLVDGPFDASLPDLRRPWIGSRNQGFHVLTPRYAGLAERLTTLPDRVEVRLAADGAIFLNGQAPTAVLRALARAVGAPLPSPGDAS
jgi:anaerobic ribonucleoside-triphosphate reductase activating protein